MKPYLHPEALSPDPLYGHSAGTPAPGGYTAVIYPHRWVRCSPAQPVPLHKPMDLLRPAGPVVLRPGAQGRIDCVLDFGTELEAGLEVIVRLSRPSSHLFVAFGESLPEAEGQGIPTTNPLSTLAMPALRKGLNRHRFPARGFRFIRLQFEDVHHPVELVALRAHAWCAFRKRQGDFQCDDPRFQRLWQTSVYTARLCARPDGYWDGIKRDRVGWYGDARVTQRTADAVFADPGPADRMLARLPVAEWTMGIPGYTFAAIAMLHHRVLTHGLERSIVPGLYARVREVLAWARRTQLNRDGFIVRDPGARYFGRVAFVDWSPMPVGGKFEELSWLQCQYVEALRLAADLATWLRRPGEARAFLAQADVLGRRILKRFWRAGRGMVHTLNQTTRRWEPLVVLPLPDTIDNAYRRRYFRLPPIGESLPSRHSQALAVWAGLVQSPADRASILRTLRSRRSPALITAYFRYFEAVARAACGDATGAVRDMVDYLADQVIPNDSSTLWEWHDPAVRDFRRWALGDWPKSLCHGWSSGLVPLVQRYVLGLQPTAPGFSRLRIDPAAALPMAFRAVVPTPFGPIRVERDHATAPFRHHIPAGIQLDKPT